MGKKLPVLSAHQLIKLLSNFGFYPVHQRGSHIKVQGVRNGKFYHTTIPVHSGGLRLGTLNSILSDLALTRADLEYRPGRPKES